MNSTAKRLLTEATNRSELLISAYDKCVSLNRNVPLRYVFGDNSVLVVGAVICRAYVNDSALGLVLSYQRTFN